MYDHGCAGEYEEGLFASGFGFQREGDVYVKDEEERLALKLSSSERLHSCCVFLPLAFLLMSLGELAIRRFSSFASFGWTDKFCDLL